MKKILSILIVVGLVLTVNVVFAKNAKNPGDDIPEQEGIYDVPGHPNMKVRVFVYKERPDNPGKPDKPGKPEPTPPSEQCGLEDPDSSEVVNATGWELPLTWEYSLNASSVPDTVGSENLETIAENSFKAWTDQVSVEINKGPDTLTAKYGLDGQNIIAWGRTSGRTLGVTYIWYYTSGELAGQVAEVDTIMNKRVLWMWSDPLNWSDPICAYTESYDAQNILTHEIGHWFGLDDHYTEAYENNTMYGYGSKMETKKDTLTTGDIIGVKSLY